MKAKKSSKKIIIPFLLFLLNSEIASLLALTILLIMFLANVVKAAEEK